MDLIMPEMDGVAATRAICAEFQCAILVVTASVDSHTGKVFEAMGAGALDAVNTPVVGASGHEQGREALIRKIDTISTLLGGTPLRRSQHTVQIRSAVSDSVPLIAIGASTGGPSALREILQPMPAQPGVAFAIVQHVDQQFASSFTSWLNDQTALPVRMAQAGESLSLNTVYVCGREEHLVMTADGTLGYQAEPRDIAYRPSVDVFFDSLAQFHYFQSVGVLLTGMGRDGAAGLKALRERGWLTLAQDQFSCAVYGMPKAAKELDAAKEILPLEDIGPRLLRWAQTTSTGSTGTRQHS
jgi:two-component system response regulator WspF